jgi:putative hydrolase of the HAD superfamily
VVARRIHAVVFDLDGMLFDRRETFRRHVKLQARRLGDLFAGVGATALERIVTLDANGTLPRNVFFPRVETELGLPTGSWSRLRDDFEAHFPEDCVPAPHLHSTLEALRAAGLKLGLITNGRIVMQTRKIDGLGIRKLFGTVVISEAAGVKKPDPRIFALALKELDVDPSRAAYVGDNPEADIAGARASGLLTIWKRDDFWPGVAAADWVHRRSGGDPGAAGTFAGLTRVAGPGGLTGE